MHLPDYSAVRVAQVEEKQERTENQGRTGNEGRIESQGPTEDQGQTENQGRTGNEERTENQGLTGKQGRTENQGPTEDQGLTDNQGQTKYQGLTVTLVKLGENYLKYRADELVDMLVNKGRVNFRWEFNGFLDEIARAVPEVQPRESNIFLVVRGAPSVRTALTYAAANGYKIDYFRAGALKSILFKDFSSCYKCIHVRRSEDNLRYVHNGLFRWEGVMI